MQFGVVAKGQDQVNGEMIAIKIFKSNLFGSVSKRSEHLHEAALLGKVEHTNVINLLETIEDEFGVYLVFPFMQRTLADEIYSESYVFELNRTKNAVKMILSAGEHI